MPSVPCHDGNDASRIIGKRRRICKLAVLRSSPVRGRWLAHARRRGRKGSHPLRVVPLRHLRRHLPLAGGIERAGFPSRTANSAVFPVLPSSQITFGVPRKEDDGMVSSDWTCTVGWLGSCELTPHTASRQAYNQHNQGGQSPYPPYAPPPGQYGGAPAASYGQQQQCECRVDLVAPPSAADATSARPILPLQLPFHALPPVPITTLP